MPLLTLQETAELLRLSRRTVHLQFVLARFQQHVSEFVNQRYEPRRNLCIPLLGEPFANLEKTSLICEKQFGQSHSTDHGLITFGSRWSQLAGGRSSNTWSDGKQ